MTGGLAVCVLALPDPAPTLAPEVAANMGATGVGNPITGVLMAFRAVDTLLEANVLLFAVVGVWSLSPDRFWGGRPGPAHVGSERDPGLTRPRPAADRHRHRDLHPVGRCGRSGRQVPGRHDPGGDVAARHHGGNRRRAARQPRLAAPRAGRRACGVHRARLRRRRLGRRVSRLAEWPGESADRRRRGRADAVARGHARAAARRHGAEAADDGHDDAYSGSAPRHWSASGFTG